MAHGLPHQRLANGFKAIQTALGPGAGPLRRRAAAQEALKIAKTMGWTDHRRAFAHFAMGRLSSGMNPKFAKEQFIIADQYYRRNPGTELHRAYVASQLAAYAISTGRGEEALAIVKPHLKTAHRYENAALLANLMLQRSEALVLTGRVSEARTVHLDSLGWARYGFGADWAAHSRLRTMTGYNSQNGPNG